MRGKQLRDKIVQASERPMLPWLTALDRVLKSWEGTPYSEGQACKGKGADCVGFVAGVLDELHGYPLVNPDRLSPDTSWHDPAACHQKSLELSKRWPHRILDHSEPMQPGDVLIGRAGKGEGHVMIVGVEPFTVWHSVSGVGVCYTGILLAMKTVIRGWRPTERESWQLRS